MKAAIKAALALLVASAEVMPAHAGQKIYSVCDLVLSGPHLDGARVRLKARLDIPFYDISAFLHDPSCRGAVDYDEPPVAARQASVRKFDRALYGSGGLPVSYTVDVSGRFHWNTHWKPPFIMSGVMKPQPRGVLTVEKFWSFARLD